ncbi:hypothetical protein [Streptomyces sp. NBC_01304]|uniref:hypothetical protein n=1 Tax=Streptomyces sp. NBC_01304 TaxID=2903818 RepID=UPI002E0E4CD1|nr:hypothetical protein OG430_49185 [Streptomyces sp. NBC_01304]
MTPRRPPVVEPVPGQLDLFADEAKPAPTVAPTVERCPDCTRLTTYCRCQTQERA